MKKIKLLFLIVPMALIALLIGCGKDSKGTSGSLFDSFDRKGMLQNIGQNIILKDIEQFNTAAAQLQDAIVALQADANATTLSAAQAAWNNAHDKWSMCVPYNFGPMEDQLLQPKIDKWPVNTAAIEANISSATTIDNDYINTKGSSEKGLKALEYLLFDFDAGNTAVLEKLTTASSATNRLAYLKALAQNIQEQSNKLYTAWSPSGGNYLSQFVNADGNDVSSSVGKLVNVFAFYIDVVKNLKVGNAIGKMTDDMPHPDMVELYESNRSMQALKLNLQSMEQVFKGGSGQGFDDLLNHMKAQRNGSYLTEVTLAGWQNIYTKADAITTPLQVAVTSDNSKVQALYTSLKEQLVFIKVDMVNNLGVALTFSDDDGD